MASRTISLKEETYHDLLRIEGEEESFSDVIDRLLEPANRPLNDLIGLLDADQVPSLREGSQVSPRNVDERGNAASDG